jgi:hypothetical protein
MKNNFNMLLLLFFVSTGFNSTRAFDQSQICEHLVDNEISKYKKSIELLKTFKKSLITLDATVENYLEGNLPEPTMKSIWPFPKEQIDEMIKYNHAIRDLDKNAETSQSQRKLFENTVHSIAMTYNHPLTTYEIPLASSYKNKSEKISISDHQEYTAERFLREIRDSDYFNGVHLPRKQIKNGFYGNIFSARLEIELDNGTGKKIKRIYDYTGLINSQNIFEIKIVKSSIINNIPISDPDDILRGDQINEECRNIWSRKLLELGLIELPSLHKADVKIPLPSK